MKKYEFKEWNWAIHNVKGHDEIFEKIARHVANIALDEVNVHVKLEGGQFAVYAYIPDEDEVIAEMSLDDCFKAIVEFCGDAVTDDDDAERILNNLRLMLAKYDEKLKKLETKRKRGL